MAYNWDKKEGYGTNSCPNLKGKSGGHKKCINLFHFLFVNCNLYQGLLGESTVHIVTGSGQECRQFVALLEKHKSEYGDIGYHKAFSP